MELHPHCDELSNDSEPSWESIVLIFGVWAAVAVLLILTVFIRWAGTWDNTLFINFWVANLRAAIEVSGHIETWLAIPRVVDWQVFTPFLFCLLSLSPLLLSLTELCTIIECGAFFLEVFDWKFPG